MSPPTPHARPARRCNADYRWTVPKARAFLQALSRCGSVAEAARGVGMSRNSAYRLRAKLAAGPLSEAFEAARAMGFAARAARGRSRWEGPGLDALDALDARRTATPQGDGRPDQGDARDPQGDAPARKVTV